MTESTQPQRPLQGLAEWLRAESRKMEKNWSQIHQLRQWASEVEAAQSAGAAVVQALKHGLAAARAFEETFNQHVYSPTEKAAMCADIAKIAAALALIEADEEQGWMPIEPAARGDSDA